MRNKKVIYIEDGFPKEDQMLIGSLQTAVKRYMAAEYSRQLSGKVFHGCVKVSEQGYSAGGTPCYGMARELLDEHKQPIRFLKRGEHKEISNQRVRFVPLQDETTQTVRNIFAMFVHENTALSFIASTLNERGIPSATGALWDRDKVVRILMNETYTGARIYNKTWNRLRQGKRGNPRHEWVICRDASPPIVSREIFDTTQEKLWFLLGKWKQGRRAIKEARRLIFSGISDFFTKKGIAEDDLFFMCRDFPMVLSVTTDISSTGKEWCFILPDDLRNNSSVLAIGVVPERSHPIDRFFIIPTASFGIGGVCILTEKERAYARYAITTEHLEENILKLAHISIDTEGAPSSQRSAISTKSSPSSPCSHS